MTWNKKDLITIEELTREELDTIFRVTASLKKILSQGGQIPALAGKTVVSFFLEPSTRTRIAFEMAAKRLSADNVLINAPASSVVKGETLRDTAQNIQALNADIIVLRHSAAGSPLYLSKLVDIPVINAGDGAHEHPTQALLDCFTMQEHLGDLTGKKVTILGDIVFSRVARSNIWALKKLGAEVTLVGPSTLVPECLTTLGATVYHDLKPALADAEAVMLLRIQHERQSTAHFPSLAEYTSMFGLSKTRASWLKPNAIIMHPGPINRGVEIDSDLADSSQSVILQQVTNGIAVRMAVLYLCSGGSPDDLEKYENA